MSQKQKNPDNTAGDVDLLDKEKSKNKVQPPKKYKIVYHNDDFTPMELVVFSLMNIYHLDKLVSTTLMLEVHQKGKSIIQGGLSKEIAETKVNRTVQFFRAQGYPLLATCEREE